VAAAEHQQGGCWGSCWDRPLSFALSLCRITNTSLSTEKRRENRRSSCCVRLIEYEIISSVNGEFATHPAAEFEFATIKQIHNRKRKKRSGKKKAPRNSDLDSRDLKFRGFFPSGWHDTCHRTSEQHPPCDSECMGPGWVRH